MSVVVAPRSVTRICSVRRRIALAMACTLVLLACLWWAVTHVNLNPRYRVGQEVDKLDDVVVFYNGGVAHSSGRNLAPDGYNLGIKYQCVEFVKRYYYEHFNHKMPDSYGHAKHFFDPELADGARNTKRDLVQYVNGSTRKPHPGDLLVLGPSVLNRYGHVAIVSEVTESDIEIVQQNPGPFGSSRERISFLPDDEGWRLDNRRVLGWLRKAPNRSNGGQAAIDRAVSSGEQ